MKKEKKTNNKNSIITLLFIIIILLITIIILIIPKDKTSNNMISNISINGIRIGKKANKRMKNLVMDASFKFEYKNVGFDVDDNDYITEIHFYRTQEGIDGPIYDIKKANILYKGNKLTTIKDFENILGKGKTSKDLFFKIIEYKEDNLTLRLYIENNEIYNIEIEKK